MADIRNNHMLTLTIRIDWSEIDLFGHVNNVIFFKYIQAARVNYWEQIGLYQHFLKTQQGPIVASVKCDFRSPLHYPGTVNIKTRMRNIGTTSFSLEHQLLNEQGTIVAEAEDVIVMFDFSAGKKMEFPKEFRKRVEELEDKTFPEK